MLAFGYSAAKPNRIATKLWTDGIRNILKGEPGAAKSIELTMLPKLDGLQAKMQADPSAKFLLCKADSVQTKLGSFLRGPAASQGSLKQALNLADNQITTPLHNPSSFAVLKAPDLQEGFRASEHKAKSRRITLFMQPMSPIQQGGPTQQRFMSYHDFVKWELSAYLDAQAEKFNVHAFSWAQDADAEFDVQDIILRMKRNHSVSLHKMDKFDEVASLIGNSHRFITDDRNLALMANSIGVKVVFLSNLYAADDQDAALLGPGYLDPFTVSAETLVRRFAELDERRNAVELVKSAKASAAEALNGTPNIFLC